MIDRDGAYWKKAFSVSCALHLAAFAAIGAAANFTNGPPERFIAIELNASEEEVKFSPALVPADHSASKDDSATPRQARATAKSVEKIESARDKDLPLGDESEKGADNENPADRAPQPIGEGKGSIEGGENLGLGGELSASGETQGGSSVGQVSASPGFGAADRAAAIERFVAAVEAQNRRNYPYMALKRNLTGRAVVHVELDGDGNLISAYIGASSGIELLDNAAVKAVRAVCPFRHGLGAELAMDVPVSYTLGG